VLWRQLFRFDTKQSLPVIIALRGLFGKEQEGKRMMLKKEQIERLNQETIFEDDVFCEILDIDDEVERERLIIALEEQAQRVGGSRCRVNFIRLLRAYLKQERRIMREVRERWAREGLGRRR